MGRRGGEAERGAERRGDAEHRMERHGDAWRQERVVPHPCVVDKNQEGYLGSK